MKSEIQLFNHHYATELGKKSNDELDYQVRVFSESRQGSVGVYLQAFFSEVFYIALVNHS